MSAGFFDILKSFAELYNVVKKSKGVMQNENFKVNIQGK